MRAEKVGTPGRQNTGKASGAEARFNAAQFFLTRDNNGKIPTATPKRIDGDIIGVDLLELVTKKILGLENTPLADWNAAQLAAYGAQLNKLGNFSLDQSVIDSFTAKEGASLPPMQLVTKEAKGKEVYSRMYTNGPTPAEFKDSGVLYLAPTITEQDETKLRAGKKIDTKPAVTLSFWYGEKNAAGVFEQKQGTVSVTANDIKEVQTFFGDRPLDNPGYSKFELIGSVGVDSSNTNDVLDKFRVEQRLKYLGFPAMGTTPTDAMPTVGKNSIQKFKVDGVFAKEEAAALKLFEKIVRYTDVTVSGSNKARSVQLNTADNKAYVNVVVTVEASSDGPNGTGNISSTANDPAWLKQHTQFSAVRYAKGLTLTAAQKKALTAELKTLQANWDSPQVQQAVAAAAKLAETAATKQLDDAADKSTSFKRESPGADGLIEASGNPQAKLTTDWLNAYNAPHWMQLFAATPGGDYPYAASNPALIGWKNMQKGQLPSTAEPTNIELYGTSWMYDLMAAKQFAPDSLRQSGSWFNGATDANYGFSPKWNGPQYYANGDKVTGQHSTHDLGMAFDLGVSGYINPKTEQLYTNDPGNAKKKADIQKLPPVTWSVTKANEYAGYLVGTKLNNQQAAIRDFLSLYALTQADGQAGLEGEIVNTTAARLFGGMITGVHIGGSPNGSYNPYPSINAILNKLGIYSSAVDPHHHHFHIYLKPPTPEQIGPNHLLADAATALAFDLATPATLQGNGQGLIDYTQTLIEGEELMFIMDVPTIPAQETPIVLVQAEIPAAGASTQPDYILKDCQETESTGDPMSAIRGIDPAGMLAVYIQNHNNRTVDSAMLVAIKPILLQDTTHGKLNHYIEEDGHVYFMYDPTPDYVGNDRAVFQAEFEGKVYKIVLELHVFRGGVPGDFGASTCPEPQLIKVKKPATPSSGANGYDLNSPTSTNSGQASASLVAGITVTFADLEGAAIGQTTGTTITLDPNAANYNWYIDPTPGQNEEYLPTSNPNEWVAKAGSAAAGKMDMLSVLLHEYGHALGINHSADPNDYMGTTLTAGVRRLPSAEEMALMQGLVAQAKATLSPSPSPASGGGEFPTLPLGTSFIGFLGLLRSSRYGGVNIVPDESRSPYP